MNQDEQRSPYFVPVSWYWFSMRSIISIAASISSFSVYPPATNRVLSESQCLDEQCCKESWIKSPEKCRLHYFFPSYQVSEVRLQLLWVLMLLLVLLSLWDSHALNVSSFSSIMVRGILKEKFKMKFQVEVRGRINKRTQWFVCRIQNTQWKKSATNWSFVTDEWFSERQLLLHYFVFSIFNERSLLTAILLWKKRHEVVRKIEWVPLQPLFFSFLWFYIRPQIITLNLFWLWDFCPQHLAIKECATQTKHNCMQLHMQIDHLSYMKTGPILWGIFWLKVK